jgi:hypothetical protein
VLTASKRTTLAVIVLILACTGGRPSAPLSSISYGAPGLPGTFAAAGEAAVATLEHTLYTGGGAWRTCVPDDGCGKGNVDWGTDSLTYALAFRWKTRRDSSIPPIIEALTATARTYGTCRLPGCRQWSDVPEWDSIAASREYQIARDPRAFAKAKAAFDVVDRSNAYALGACPSLDYQRPRGGANKLKTLETDSNYIKAALLLYRATNDRPYLRKAIAKYAAVRRYFLDPDVPLYSVYVFDDGAICTQLPRRFFASVNGNMIANGLALAAATGDGRYRAQALATAHAVADDLSDAAGIFVDLQAENDIVEPLVEAMYDVAVDENQAFARTWLLSAATAASSDRASTGLYGRFFDGPAPVTTITGWSANGGLALAIAAAALDPSGTAQGGYWTNATFVSDDIATLPASLTFAGRAIALIGTLGERCCEPGHARVFIDGTETFDRTGIWQNKSSSGKVLPNSILFAWRWPSWGRHTLQLAPGRNNGKEGGSFLHIAGYVVVP